MKHTIVLAIKILSILLMTAAIAFELGRLLTGFPQAPIPPLLQTVIWLERFALIAHLIEGAIAIVYAPFKGKPALQSGLYTFFVGTVGLIEVVTEPPSTTPKSIG